MNGKPPYPGTNPRECCLTWSILCLQVSLRCFATPPLRLFLHITWSIIKGLIFVMLIQFDPQQLLVRSVCLLLLHLCVY